MSEDTEPVASADQDSWVDIAQRMRNELAKAVPVMGAMKIDELKVFVDTVQAAFWLNKNAETWDKQIALEMAKVTAAD
jgi:hypothetical protein